MGRKDDFWDDLATVGSYIGGAWLISEFIKALSKPVYRCPHCHTELKEKQTICPNCNLYIHWQK